METTKKFFTFQEEFPNPKKPHFFYISPKEVMNKFFKNTLTL